MLNLREEMPQDIDAIREVNAAAFGRTAEGRLIERLRNGELVVVSLVAVIQGDVVGNIVFSALPIKTRTASIDAVALAPMAVRPEEQRRGIGTALANEGLRICKERGYAAAIVLGHPSYYRRFGFSQRMAEDIKGPYCGPAWMALELIDGALADIVGSVTYPDAFDDV